MACQICDQPFVSCAFVPIRPMCRILVAGLLPVFMRLRQASSRVGERTFIKFLTCNLPLLYAAIWDTGSSIEVKEASEVHHERDS
jgi:hypothetical protein